MNFTALKTLKENLVSEATAFDGEDDIAPLLEVYRGEDLVAIVSANKVDRDRGLEMTRIAVFGMSADRISLAMDAHITATHVNPDTGKEWQSGEMQRACERGACDTGLITDCLIVVDGYASGRLVQATLPYHVHKADKKVVWIEGTPMNITSDTDVDGLKATGLVVDAITEAFAQTNLFRELEQNRMGPALFGLDTKSAQIHADCAVAKYLTQHEYTVVLLPYSELANEIITRSMAGSGSQ